MEISVKNNKSDKNKSFVYKDGKFYFTRQIERYIYFYLTMAMLMWGILYKVGIL